LSDAVTVVVNDYSPRAAKHFFVWNPPLLDENGKSLGSVTWPKKTKNESKALRPIQSNGPTELSLEFLEQDEKDKPWRKEIRRRHAADETALLLARAVTQGIRCIAFCKKRCLVE
jgi:DEAD/DEAH box helicase domain-containing protein